MRKLIVYGNCQAGAVALILKTVPYVAERWDVVQHDIWASGDVLASNLADFETADILLQQDIWTWRNHPMRDKIPEGIAVVRFPFCYIAALWPFDAWLIGNDDAMLKAREKHQAVSKDPFPFAFHDGLLAKLRTIIPDPEERFERYRSLDLPPIPDFQIPDFRRYAEFEEARLAKDDRQLGFNIGKFMTNNFRGTRLFHACVHPTAGLLEELTAEIMGRIGLDPHKNQFRPLADYMSGIQVPLHPKVIEQIGLTWANDSTLYSQPDGEKLTFDEYYRRYVNYPV